MIRHGDTAADEAQIRKLIDDRLKAIRAKDGEGAMAGLASDIVSFDLAPPLEYRGAAANRKSLDDWFASFRGAVGLEVRDLALEVGRDVAFCRSLNRISGARTDGTDTGVWVRSTQCFRKAGGRWVLAHEHMSVPFEMAPPFRASLDLQPA